MTRFAPHQVKEQNTLRLEALCLLQVAYSRTDQNKHHHPHIHAEMGCNKVSCSGVQLGEKKQVVPQKAKAFAFVQRQSMVLGSSNALNMNAE